MAKKLDLTFEQGQILESEQMNQIVDAINDGGSLSDLILPVTYEELRDLRDQELLIPGVRYRITDFVTTTSQEGTVSAGHPYDLIVQAVEAGKLSEVGIKAAIHEEEPIYEKRLYKTNMVVAAEQGGDSKEVDTGDYYLLDGTIMIDGVTYYKWRKYCWNGGVQPYWILTDVEDISVYNPSLQHPYFPCGTIYDVDDDNQPEETDKIIFKHNEQYKREDLIVAIDEINGTPCLRKTNFDHSDYLLPDEEEYYVLLGEYEIDGDVYYRWIKSTVRDGVDNVTQSKYILTDTDDIVCSFDNPYEPIAYMSDDDSETYHRTSDRFIEQRLVDISDDSGATYFDGVKLEAWELKYCLDNDKSRFGWAAQKEEYYKGLVVYDEVNDVNRYFFLFDRIYNLGYMWVEMDYSWVDSTFDSFEDFLKKDRSYIVERVTSYGMNSFVTSKDYSVGDEIKHQDLSVMTSIGVGYSDKYLRTDGEEFVVRWSKKDPKTLLDNNTGRRILQIPLCNVEYKGSHVSLLDDKAIIHTYYVYYDDDLSLPTQFYTGTLVNSDSSNRYYELTQVDGFIAQRIEKGVEYTTFNTDIEFQDMPPVTQVFEPSQEGKGVVYYMKDEHNNECEFDFKNIQKVGTDIRCGCYWDGDRFYLRRNPAKDGTNTAVEGEWDYGFQIAWDYIYYMDWDNYEVYCNMNEMTPIDSPDIPWDEGEKRTFYTDTEDFSTCSQMPYDTGEPIYVLQKGGSGETRTYYFGVMNGSDDSLHGASHDNHMLTDEIDGVKYIPGKFQKKNNTAKKQNFITVGEGIEQSDDSKLSLLPATGGAIGGVIVGDNLKVNDEGLLSADVSTDDIKDLHVRERIVEYPELKEYLTIEAIESANVKIVSYDYLNGTCDIEISIDGGKTWTSKKIYSDSRPGRSATIVSLEVGDKVLLRRRTTGLSSTYRPFEYCNVQFTGDCYVYGNIDSLTDPYNFAFLTKYINKEGEIWYSDDFATRVYDRLFKGNTHLLSHPKKRMYVVQERAILSETFDGCTRMEKSPVILSNIITTIHTFNGCTNLRQIDCLSHTVYQDSMWVNGVAASGTFVKRYDAPAWVAGGGIIPEGWNTIIAEYEAPSSISTQYFKVLDDGSVYIKDIGGFDGTNMNNSDTLQETVNSLGTNLEYIVNNISTQSVTLTQELVDMTDGTTIDTSLYPNKMYMFGEKEEINITELTQGLPGIVNEYMFQFTSGATATVLTVPNGVNWMIPLRIMPNKTYQVSIENGLAVLGVWNNE